MPSDQLFATDSATISPGGRQQLEAFFAANRAAGYVIAGQQVQGLPPASFGYIWLPALVIVAAGSVLTAPLGARAAHALPVPVLKKVFATILYLLAAYMAWKGLSA